MTVIHHTDNRHNVTIHNVDPGPNYQPYEEALEVISRYGDARYSQVREFKEKPIEYQKAVVKELLMAAAREPIRKGAGPLIDLDDKDGELKNLKLAKILEAGPDEVEKYDFDIKFVTKREYSPKSGGYYYDDSRLYISDFRRVESKPQVTQSTETIERLEAQVERLEQQVAQMSKMLAQSTISHIQTKEIW